MPVGIAFVSVCLIRVLPEGDRYHRGDNAGRHDGGVDLLADALRVSGARGSVGTRVEAGGRWGLWLDTFPGAALHVVTCGTAWLTVPGTQPHALHVGDVVLLPPGTEHGLASEPGVMMGACDRESALRARAAGGVVTLGSAPRSTSFLTLHYEQDHAVSTPVLTSLSGPVHVAASEQSHLDDTVRLLTRELAHPQVGTTAAVDSIIDLLLVQLIRAWLTTQAVSPPRFWLGALLDPVVRDALECIHREPGRAWTTATLAAATRVSRATLSRRFPAAIGQTPGAYLTGWRIDLAAARLRDTDEPVEAVSAAVGYTSPHAFSRAFRRARGQAPGAYRTSVRARSDPLTGRS